MSNQKPQYITSCCGLIRKKVEVLKDSQISNMPTEKKKSFNYADCSKVSIKCSEPQLKQLPASNKSVSQHSSQPNKCQSQENDSQPQQIESQRKTSKAYSQTNQFVVVDQAAQEHNQFEKGSSDQSSEELADGPPGIEQVFCSQLLTCGYFNETVEQEIINLLSKLKQSQESFCQKGYVKRKKEQLGDLIITYQQQNEDQLEEEQSQIERSSQGSRKSSNKSSRQSSRKSLRQSFGQELNHEIGDGHTGLGCRTCLVNGSFEQGQFKNGRLDGKGRIIMQQGAYYEGDFKQGVPHGWGRYVNEKSNYLYYGEWSEDKPHGVGFEKLQDGTTYVGSFRHGEKHGNGRQSFPSGVVYRGLFRNDQIHGHGNMKLSDSMYYNGEFQNNRMTGFGKITKLQIVTDQANEEVIRWIQEQGEFHDRQLVDCTVSTSKFYRKSKLDGSTS